MNEILCDQCGKVMHPNHINVKTNSLMFWFCSGECLDAWNAKNVKIIPKSVPDSISLH